MIRIAVKARADTCCLFADVLRSILATTGFLMQPPTQLPNASCPAAEVSVAVPVRTISFQFQIISISASNLKSNVIHPNITPPYIYSTLLKLPFPTGTQSGPEDQRRSQMQSSELSRGIEIEMANPNLTSLSLRQLRLRSAFRHSVWPV